MSIAAWVSMNVEYSASCAPMFAAMTVDNGPCDYADHADFCAKIGYACRYSVDHMHTCICVVRGAHVIMDCAAAAAVAI